MAAQVSQRTPHAGRIARAAAGELQQARLQIEQVNLAKARLMKQSTALFLVAVGGRLLTNLHQLELVADQPLEERAQGIALM